MDRNLCQELQNYEDPRNSVEQEETSTLESQAIKSRPTEWTNEKHSLYLKSMEASFVDQLYRSLDFFGSTEGDWQSKPTSSKHKKSSPAHSGQYKVFKDGCWSKIGFTRDEPRPRNAEDSRGNPWIQRYKQAPRSSSVYHSKTSSPSTVNQFHARLLRRQDSIGSNTEAMGQNFNDEDLEEENSSRMHDIKRSKTSTDNASSNDQVVPFGLPQEGYAAEEHMSSKDCLEIIDNN